MTPSIGARVRRLARAGTLALLLSGVAGAAMAAQSPRDAKLDAMQRQLDAMGAELQQLRAAGGTSQDRLDAFQAQLDAMKADLEATRAEAQADHAQIETLPQQVKSAVAAAVPAKGWEATTSISGRMYYDITNISQKSNGVSQSTNGTNFDIKRFYVGIDHKFNDTFSGNITTDFQYSSAINATEIYIKKAYLQAKFNDGFVVRVGSTDLPWVPFMEDQYGYRYVENVMVDRDKFGTSADWGVHVSGKLAGGMVNYAVSAVNGAGYKSPTRSHGIDLEGRVNLNVQNFVFAVGGYTGKLGKDVVNGPPTFHTANRFDAAAIYAHPRFRVGVEYFRATNWTAVTSVASDSADGVSVFGSVKVTPQVSVFGRYDWVEPRRDTKPALRDNYFNLGVSYSPAKIVDFALVYKRDKIDNGTLATSNGTIGGSVDGTYDEIGLWGQFRW